MYKKKEVLLKFKDNINEIIIDKNIDYKYIFDGRKDKEFNKDIKFVINKNNVNCNVTVKGLIYGGNIFVFKPLIIIKKNSVNVNISLKIELLNFSNDSYINVCPNMEISENKINGANHSFVLKSIDKMYINYLLSRGLSIKQINNLIIKSFLQ